MRSLTFLFVCIFSANVFAMGGLDLVDGDRQTTLSLEYLRADPTLTHSAYAPFRKREVTFRGYDFDEFLEQHFGRKVTEVEIQAIDGYRIKLTGFTGQHWMLVTHEDETPLELRSHGPLRLIQTDLGGRDPENMSLFDDWIWMIQRIEATSP